MCHFGGFSGLNSENSLFYSVLRRPAMFEMAHHKPTKMLVLQYLQLVPAKFLVNKAFPICRLHFTFFFLGIFLEAKKCHIVPEGTNHKAICIYIYMPHTSIGGQFLGFEIYRRGKKEKRGRKGKRREKIRKEKNKFTATQKVAVNFGCFYYKTGEKATCLH